MRTSDDRRKVAERLREHDGNAYADVADMCDEDLADLIDPTCRNFGGEEGTNGECYDFACSACGYVCDLAEPKFCPRCGARVVSDDA